MNTTNLFKKQLYPINPDTNTFFYKITNLLCLLAWAFLELLSFVRYFHESTDFDTVFWVTAYIKLAIQILIVIIAIAKIFYYFKSNPGYSCLSIAALIFGGACYIAKNHDALVSGSLSIISVSITLFLIIAMYGVSLDNICRINLITIGPLYVIRVLLAVTGIFPGQIIENDDRICNDLGFGNHNAGIIMFLFLTLSATYVCMKWQMRIRNLLVCLFLVFAVLIYIPTKSRTSTLLIAVVCLTTVFLNLAEYWQTGICGKVLNFLASILKKFFKWAPSLSALVTIAGVNAFNLLCGPTQNVDRAWSFFTNHITTRFAQFAKDCALNNITLPYAFYDSDTSQPAFNYIYGSATKTHYNDNLYHHLFINYGLIFVVFFIVILQLLASYAYRSGHTALLMIIGIISLFNILENHGCLYTFDPFIIMPFTLIRALNPGSKDCHKTDSNPE